jgi:hypothetical protein
MKKATVNAEVRREGRRTDLSDRSAVQTPEGSHRLAAARAETGTLAARVADAREHLKGRLALPVPEVAELLGISSAAVRLMIFRGDLPGRKVGGGTERITFIVPTGALISWLEGTPRVVAEGAA